MNFALGAGIKMSRAMTDSDIRAIAPGGFRIKSGNNEYAFDFEQADVWIDPVNDKVLQIFCENPDMDYEQTSMITNDILEEITEISDFFIYTGESVETDLRPNKLLYAYFSREGLSGPLRLSSNVIKTAKVNCSL